MRKAAFLGLVIGLVAVSATAEAAGQRGSTVTAYARAIPSFPATSPSRFSITTTNSGGPANAGVVNSGDKLVLTFTGSTVVPGECKDQLVSTVHHPGVRRPARVGRGDGEA